MSWNFLRTVVLAWLRFSTEKRYFSYYFILATLRILFVKNAVLRLL